MWAALQRACNDGDIGARPQGETRARDADPGWTDGMLSGTKAWARGEAAR